MMQKDKKILVVGDLIIDRYVVGAVDRICPEAPVPVLAQSSSETKIGGAGNVAMNLEKLGVQVDLLSVVTSENTVDLIEKNGINWCGIVDNNYTTPLKTRYICNSQILLRVDDEDNKLSLQTSDMLLTSFKRICENYDLIILSDYNKGVLKNARDFINIAKKFNAVVLVDPKKNNFHEYKGADCITPNLSEFVAAGGIIGADDQITMSMCGFQDKYDLQNLVVTLGDQGCVALVGDEFVKYEATQAEVYDVTGAGDTFIAALAYFWVDSGNVKDAIKLANIAAGISVSFSGCYQVTHHEIEEQVRKYTDQKPKVVFTNGCFDVLHFGHLQLLKYCKSLGDRLIVGINSDESVSRLKGPSRPVYTEVVRRQMLMDIKHVDEVIIFNEDTPLDLIKSIVPDVLVKGGDYVKSQIIGADFVEMSGGAVEIFSTVEGFSTTNTLKKVIEN